MDKQKEAQCSDNPPPYPVGQYPQQQGAAPPPPPGYYPAQGQPVTGYQPMPAGTVYQPVAQGYPPGQTTVVFSPAAPLANPPPDYFAYSIFVTICCCWPIGIFAIMKASATKEAIARGDQQSAQRLSAETRKFSHLALGIGIAMVVLTFVIVGVYVGLVLSNIHDSSDWDK